MGENSKISWTHHTFNPWWGCHKNSPECDHCYADAFSRRTGHRVWGKEAPRRFFGDKHWGEPLTWNRDAINDAEARRVFCGSMCDVMEDREDLAPSRERLYSLVEGTNWLDWLLLTKFPQNYRVFLPKAWHRHPRQNVWGMTTVGCNKSMWRVKELVDTSFAIRGLSCEPILERISLKEWLPMLDWVIVGAESGARARPMDEDWVRSLRDECEDAGVAFFYKQNVINGIKIETPFLDGVRWTDYPQSKCV